MPGTDGYAAYADQPTPSGYVENEQKGTHLGLPVMRQRISSFEATGLVPLEFDEIDPTYNSDNTVATVVYKKAGVTVATITVGYTSGNITSVMRT